MSRRSLLAAAIIVAGFALSACDQLAPVDGRRAMEEAEAAAKSGDFKTALRGYERVLMDASRAPEAHYRLALIYADKVKAPVSALHHFSRYLEMEPKGSHAKEARDYQQEGEQKLLGQLGKGNLLTQSEAVRLKNEALALRTANMELRKQVASLKRMAAAERTAAGKGINVGVQKEIPPGVRTHVVEPGETFAAIAKRYYNTKAKAQFIQDTNFEPMEGTPIIKPGMILAVPESTKGAD